MDHLARFLCGALTLGALTVTFAAPPDIHDSGGGGGGGGTPSTCERDSRSDLSLIAADVLDTIENTPGAISHSPTDADRLLTTCNRLQSVEIEGQEIFSAARDLILAAEHEVDLVFFEFEPDNDPVDLIGDGLIGAQSRFTAESPLLVRILIDDADASSTMWNSVRGWLDSGLDEFRINLQLGAIDRGFLGAPLHDKYVIVDGRYLLVTGANVQSHHNIHNPWHDTGYVLEGDVALSALSAMEQVWQHPDMVFSECFGYSCFTTGAFLDPDRSWLPAAPQHPGNVPTIAVGRTREGSLVFPPNNTNNPQDIAWTRAMDLATSQIHIETPNINDDAFQDAVVRAVGRGVDVRLMTSYGFNECREEFVGGDNEEVVGNLRQRVRQSHPHHEDKFQLGWYSRDGLEPIEHKDRNNHTKYMTVDDGIAIIGSGNQDTASWNVSHEFNVLIDDAAATMQLESEIFLPDWDDAIRNYVELYEGNGATQNLVCAISTQPGYVKDVKFGTVICGLDGWIDENSAHCDNDEARSALLHDVSAGQVFRLYDNPDREYWEDDWTEIIVKRDVSRKVIGGFENSFEDADVRLIAHHDNGLDGKVSAMEFDDDPIGKVVDLYEGNNASQTLVCSNRVGGNETRNFYTGDRCANDEARSMRLYDFPVGKAIFLYDNPWGYREDDWSVIVPQRDLQELTVNSFEQAVANGDVKVHTFPNNGLDGKVSRMRIGDLSELGPIVSFYEGNNATQNKVCDLNLVASEINFQNHSQCDNDEARSMRLRFAEEGTRIELYNDPDCRTIDDYAIVLLHRYVEDLTIGSFENDFQSPDVYIDSNSPGQLDGKVSCVKISAPPPVDDRKVTGRLVDCWGNPVTFTPVVGWPGDAAWSREDGRFVASVPPGWSGTIYPVRGGVPANPATFAVGPVQVDTELGDVFTLAIAPNPTYSVSGRTLRTDGTPIPGVRIAGLPYLPFSDASGVFTDQNVSCGWSGEIEGLLDRYTFSPSSLTVGPVFGDTVLPDLVGQYWVELEQPQGNPTWTIGETRTISWSIHNTTDTIYSQYLYVRELPAGTWQWVAFLDAQTRSYDWTVAGEAGEIEIRVSVYFEGQDDLVDGLGSAHLVEPPPPPPRPGCNKLCPTESVADPG